MQRNGDGSKRLFGYDRSVPFDFKKVSQKEQVGVIVRDVNYAAYDSRPKRIDAYLVKPKQRGRFAGVIFFIGQRTERGQVV
ncbi:MAG: hypothetical protein ABI923_03755 [bacterium]